LDREVKKLQKDRGLKSVDLKFDEEHNRGELRLVNKHGAEHVINWELASTAECRQLISKYKQIEPYMEPPFVVEVVAKIASASSGNGDDASDGEVSDVSLEAEDKAEKKTAKAAPKRKVEVGVVEKSNARDLFDYVLAEGSKDF